MTKKQIIMYLLAALLALPVWGQTNFRSLTYDEALEAAKSEGKLVFMDFYTDWCGPCKLMMRDVFPLKSVGDYMNAHFVCIKVNAEKTGKDLAARYGVKAYPTFLAVDGEGKVLFTKIGKQPADEFIAEIDCLLDSDRTPERMKARYESGERTPQLISSYALYLTNQSKERGGDRDGARKADEMVHDYFSHLTEAERLSPDNLFVYKTYARSTSDSITRFWVTHREAFDASVKPEMEKALAALYKTDICEYLSGATVYDAAAYETLKKETNALGFNVSKQYDPCFRLIECHACGDMEAYLALCKEEYPKMEDDVRNAWLNGFGRLFEGQDKSVRLKASKFLRSLLPGMEVYELMFIPSQIMLLEGNVH